MPIARCPWELIAVQLASGLNAYGLRSLWTPSVVEWSLGVDVVALRTIRVRSSGSRLSGQPGWWLS